jgi:hypothetical protein
MQFLNLIENNTLTYWLRESPSILAYPTLIAIHTFGMIFLVGTSIGIALRILGFATGMPLGALRNFFRVMWIAAVISLVSGILLSILDLRTLLAMPAFYVKIGAIVAAMITARWLLSGVFSETSPTHHGAIPAAAKALAIAQLICWGIAITAGRLTAYDAEVARQTTIALVILTMIALGARYVVARYLETRATAAHTTDSSTAS